MKKSYLTYSLLAAVLAAVVLRADPPAATAAAVAAPKADASPEAEAAPKAKTEPKPMTEAQRRAESRKKAEQERLRAAAEGRKAQQESREREKRINSEVTRMQNRKVTYVDRIAEMKKLLQEPAMQADAKARYQILTQIITYTETPGWTSIGLYDFDTAHQELLPAAEAILNDKAFTSGQKLVGGIGGLMRYYCDYDRFKEAEAVVRRGMAFPDLSSNQQATARFYLADVYRYQDRYDDAMAAVRDAMQFNPVGAATKGAEIAFRFGKPEDAAALWKTANSPYEEIMFYEPHRRTDDRIGQARAFVMDTSNDTIQRFRVAEAYCFSDMLPENVAARKTLAGIPAAKKMGGRGAMKPIKFAFRNGDYPLTISLCELYAGAPVMRERDIQFIHVISLGGVGRKADAAKLAAEYAENEKQEPVDRVRFKFYEAILSGKSTDGMLPAARLTRKEEAAVIRSAARQCLSVWNLAELAEQYSADYDRYYAEKPERRIEVPYSDTPIDSITAWRTVYPRLDKQYCDIPYKGSMEFLETDVATGDRGNVQIDKDARVVSNRLEVTTLCDCTGLHIFLRAENKNARAVKHGFARGIGTELYFAPGENQPYTCFGSSSRSGITFIFPTTYNNKNAQRLDKNRPSTSFRSEVEFTDDDYVLHLFFGWDPFYNKLPANGTDWRFECIAWTPFGGFSWGGSQGIHSASAWGNLRFMLTPQQLNEIRKEIIFRTYRGYKNVPRDPGVSENLFQCWKDAEIGDPGFYAAYLEPLEKELDAYAALVNFDMDEATVGKVYSEALPRWKGLAHAVDDLRRRYLAERITATGR